MPKVTLANNSKFNKDAPCVELLKQNGFEVSLISNDAFSQGLTGDDDVIEKLNDSDAVIAAGEYYTSKVLDNLPKLKVIARFGVGFDKIDMKSATQNSVAVTITPNGNYQSVAEHAITLMMSLTLFIDITSSTDSWMLNCFSNSNIRRNWPMESHFAKSPGPVSSAISFSETENSSDIMIITFDLISSI